MKKNKYVIRVYTMFFEAKKIHIQIDYFFVKKKKNFYLNQLLHLEFAV